jgi:hypothetical protein
MPNACVFCGDDSSGPSNEHVFGDWISNLFGHYPDGTSQLLAEDGTVRSWGTVPFQDRVRVVCRRCNTGWMSQLEGRVKAVLGPMLLRGWITSLSPRTQADIAFWAAKTALVLDHLQPRARVVPETEYAALHSAQSALPAHMVWLAHRSRQVDQMGDLLGSSLKQPITHIALSENQDAGPFRDRLEQWVAEGRGMYRITFTVGRVVFQVFGHSLPTQVGISAQSEQASVVQRIWPVGGDVSWPPPVSIESIGGVEALHRAFDRPRGY